jgi:hypothetical protein
MAYAEGTVFRVHTKDFKGKNLYSFKFDGGGNDEWFRMGENRNAGVIEEGFKVRVEYELDQRDNRQIKRARVLEKGEPVAAAKPARSGGSGGGNQREANINYNVAVARAIEQVNAHVLHEAIKLPAKTKPEERRAVLDGYVDLYTARFLADIETCGAVARAADEVGVSGSLSEDASDSASEPAHDPMDDPADGNSEGEGDDW